MTQENIPPYARGYEGFTGNIGRTFSESTPAWPKEKRAPEGAPNIILMLLDDMGYSDIGPFGSEIPTPTLDKLAANGLRLNNYHTTPVCSPARAAALTGLNPHRAGFGSVANSDPGYPGFRLELAEDVTTLPEILRGSGYATWAIGKWHLTRDALLNAAADKSTWPLQRGFDQYYGALEGFNTFFSPNQLVIDNSIIQREHTPDGYYLTDDYTDKALEYIKGLRASDSRKPFFLYFAHTAMHGPLGAKKEDIDRHRGKYDQGWDKVRYERYRKQIQSGLFPDSVQLPEAVGKLGKEIPAWEDIDESTRSIYAKYMEVYAAMVDNVDQNLGRIVELLENLDELDNTIIVFTSDNGGSGEGGPEGTRSYFSRFAHLPGLPEDFNRDVDLQPELIGGPQTMVHYPEGWANVSNTPFRYYKGQTYAGGIRVPLIISWPQGIKNDHGAIRKQYQYVTDLTPTLLELAGLEHPRTRNNLPAQDVDGTSFAPILRNGAAPTTHPLQYTEFGGNRGLFKEGWKIVSNHIPGTSFDDSEFELYHVDKDPNEIHNLASDHPEKVLELAKAWQRAAWENTVFPINDRADLSAHLRRDAEQEFEKPVTLRPGTPKLERYRSSKLTKLRSFDVEILVNFTAGNQGVLVSHGDQGGGYIVYIQDGQLRFALNEYGKLVETSAGALSPGLSKINLRVIAAANFHSSYIIEVDGKQRASLENTWSLVGFAPFSGIDVGINRGGPVHWGLYEQFGSFRYTGNLISVRYIPGDKAPYDPEVLAELELDVESAGD